MRTTVTLDPDVQALLRRAMAERSVGFKVAVNDALRRGLAGPSEVPAYSLDARELGIPLVSLEKALGLAASLEDEELARRVSLRK